MSIQLSSKNFIPRSKRSSKDRGPRPAGKWITKKVRWAIYALDGYQCRSCGKHVSDMTGNEILTLDHLACWSKWGSNAACNLITLCRSCNSSRGDKSINNWIDSLDESTKARITFEISERIKILNKSNITRFSQQIVAAAFWIANGQDMNKAPNRLQ